ncbi:MAG: transposase, partial [Thiohalocapsa sp.]
SMARPLRIDLAGGPDHVTARGDRREPFYRDNADRNAWLNLFGEVCERFSWRCLGWRQMTNHNHFVIETSDANLSAGMRQLNGVYTQHFNRAHRPVGHLFQERFKAILVERDAYFLDLSRYVVLHPVRARMCGRAGWRLELEQLSGNDGFGARAAVP